MHIRRRIQRRTRRGLGLAGLAALVAVAMTAYAQSGQRRPPAAAKPTYDGRYGFVRLRYTDDAIPGCWTNEGPGWHHDYPTGERHLMQILAQLATADVRVDSSLVLAPDDPELLKYPIAYLSEPGCWQPTAAEVTALRAYLAKGGFLIVDDFRGTDWTNFAAQMQRVLPGARFQPLTLPHAVFGVFFALDTLELRDPRSGRVTQFRGLYQDNDSTQRLLVVANYDGDIADFWQWSAQGLLPVAATNEAYKFGVNYVLYGFTH